MVTVRNLITRSLRKSGVITKSETPDADEISDALEECNSMLGSWSIEKLLCISRTRESFPSTGAHSYTIGSGGDFNTTRPVKIISAFARLGTNDDYPMTEITDKNYSLIQNKDTIGAPDFFNYDNGYPLGTLTMYPKPSASYTIHIYSEKAIAGFVSLSQVVSLPEGWEDAIVYGLAVRLAPEYGQPVSNELAALAIGSKSAIKRAINRNRPLAYFPQKLSQNSINSGYNN